LGQRLAFNGSTVFYPAGGCDAWTVFALDPQCRELIKVSLEKYGSLQEISAGISRIKQGLSQRQELFTDLATSYKFDALKALRARKIDFGAYELFKLAAYVQFTVCEINYFDLEQGGLVSYGPGPHSRVTLLDAQGTIRTLWHFSGNFDQPNEAFLAFVKDKHPENILVKAALDLFHPIEGGLFYRYFADIARDSKARILCDRPLSYKYYPIWQNLEQVDKQTLAPAENFGYCRGLEGEPVMSGNGQNVLTYSEMLKAVYSNQVLRALRV
jgi:hypothetical protein